jgi:hypothetical protein
VVFRNPQTNEVDKVLNFENSYAQVGDYYVMTRQIVHSQEQEQTITTEFNFSNVKLLEPVAR